MKGKKGGENTNMFDEMNVISSYPLQQAVEDGVLVEIFKNRWKELSEDRPIVATAHIFEEVSLAGLMEIWNEFVAWRRDVCPTLPEEERLFSTSMNSRKVWVIEDRAAFTLMYPEDY
jgi:hypothetical protein